MNVLPFTLSLGHLSVIVVGLLIYILTNRINHSRRPPGSAIAWVLLLIAFPYLGIPLYLLFGARKMPRKIALHHTDWTKVIQPTADTLQLEKPPLWAHSVLKAIDAPPAVWCPEIAFEADGRIALLNVLELIDSARRELVVCTFILGNDETASRIMDALIVAAHRDVKVRVIVDAIGSLPLSRENIYRLQQAQIEIKRFMPIIRNPVKGKTNLRNHRKFIIADRQQLWSGGRNLAEEYFLDQTGKPAWLDISFRASGDIAKVMLEVFESDWEQASYPRQVGSQKLSREAVTHSAIDAFYRLQETWHQLSSTIKQSMTEAAAKRKNHKTLVEKSFVELPAFCPVYNLNLQVIASGPDHEIDTIYTLLISAIFQAKESFIAVTPYFVPDDAITSALCLAARRGVKVSLYVPARSNHKLADLARSRALRMLAQAGAQIHMLQSMSHAKAYIIDQQIALLGSANLDMRSLFLNYEVMTAIYGTAAIAWLEQWAHSLDSIAHPFDAQEPGFAKDVLEGIVRSVAFEL